MTDAVTMAEREEIYRKNWKSLWTPYQIEVLLHHYASSAAFPRHKAPAYPHCLRSLRAAGLMERGGTVLTLAGMQFVVRLCNTPVHEAKESPPG